MLSSIENHLSGGPTTKAVQRAGAAARRDQRGDRHRVGRHPRRVQRVHDGARQLLIENMERAAAVEGDGFPSSCTFGGPSTCNRALRPAPPYVLWPYRGA